MTGSGTGSGHRQFQQRLVDFTRQHLWFRKPFDAIAWDRSRTVISLFDTLLPSSGRLLDIGSGTGHVAALLDKPGRTVVACDIMDLLMLPLPYVVCDGSRLSFRDGSFDAAMLITVMHHVPAVQHAIFFSEAARVLRPGGRLVLVEDTYHTRTELAMTKLFDSAMNAEFSGHPHANRRLKDWIALMTTAGFGVTASREQVRWYGPFRVRHGIAVGERQ